MAGLLDAILMGSRSGLLDSLLYPSPLLQRQEQPMPDTMAGFIPPEPPNPFGPTPQLSPVIPPAPVLPRSVFNQGTAGLPGLMPGAMQPASPQAAPQPAAPPVAPQPEPPVTQVNDIGVGGYQMPRFGGVADYTPQARPVPTDVSAQSRSPEPAQQTLPPAFGGGPSLGRMFNPDGLIARLTGNDSRSAAQQNLRAQYDALVPLVGPQKAMLAVMNPEAGKTILAQALEKKNYGFTKLDGDTVLRQDPQTGKVEVAYGGDTKTNTIAGPDGKPITIPEGLDSAGRKTFINEIAKINADAAAGKRTGEQATAEIFANKMELSNKTLSSLANQGTSLVGKVASGLPLGNYVQSPEYQKYKQAASNFITALLRKESGAAIGKEEFDRYDREYMPQPGDSREVIAQKADARKIAIEAMKKGAGPGYKSPETSPATVRKYNPATGRIE
jgi:hypothetical protein